MHAKVAAISAGRRVDDRLPIGVKETVRAI